MTVKECYKQIGGNYEEVLQRLMSDERIRKYLLKFIDSDSMQKMREALEREDYKEAFLHVHSLKGMSLNLGLTGLSESSQVLCEALRTGEPAFDTSPLSVAVEQDYERIAEAVERKRLYAESA